MAKIVAPFMIIGTIDDYQYFEQSGQNIMREKGATGISKEQFKHPKFAHIRKHGKEWGHCSLQSRTFRFMLKPLFDQSKEVSFAGRVNSLLFGFLEDDKVNPKGKRLLSQALDTTPHLADFIGFEGNKLRPLSLVLKKEVSWNWDTGRSTLLEINPAMDIEWPDAEANQVSLLFAVSNWNYHEGRFETHYSSEVFFERQSNLQTCAFPVKLPENQNLWFAWLFIGFHHFNRRKLKPLIRKYNTVSCIAVKEFRG